MSDETATDTLAETATQEVPESGAAEEVEAKERPDYYPEKFWDADQNEPNVEALAQGYNELERFVGKKTDDIREEVIRQQMEELNQNRPEAPDKYLATFSEDSPFKEIEDQLSYDDPVLKMWADVSHKAGLSNDEFSEGIHTYLEAMATGPDIAQEVERLGENGQARVDAVDMWVRKNLNDDMYEALSGQIRTAEAFQALESLMNTNKPAQTNAYNAESVTAKPEKTDIQAAMDDPKYWDPARRDAAYVKQVENMVRRASV